MNIHYVKLNEAGQAVHHLLHPKGLPAPRDYVAFTDQPDAPKVTPVPQEVSSKQLKFWLLDHGHYETVLGFLNNPANWPNEVAKKKAFIHWSTSQTFQRRHPLTLGIQDVLGLSDDEVDAAFITAAATPV